MLYTDTDILCACVCQPAIIYTMIDFRLLLIAATLVTVAYVWNTSSRVPVPVVTKIEPVYDYIIGNVLKRFPFSISFVWLMMLNFIVAAIDVAIHSA